MAKPTITEFDPLLPLIVQKYESYLPTAFDESMTLLEKMNKIIAYLNQMGIRLDDVTNQWNSVIEWVMNEGLDEAVVKRINEMVEDGSLAQLINETIFEQLNARITLLSNYNIDHEQAQLGNELIGSTGWTTAGWVGSYSTGFSHVSGQVAPLVYPVQAEANTLYVVQLTVEDADVLNSGFKFFVRIGNSELFEMYKGTGSIIGYIKGVRSIDAGNFEIVPTADFTGTVKNISVKKITNIVGSTQTIRNGAGESVYEMRPTKESFNNLHIGKQNGRYTYGGYENTSVGNKSFRHNVGGFWNSVLGVEALDANINGSRNIAVGYRSLNANKYGARNVAVGTFAMARMETGNYNVAVGSDSLWNNKTGNYNIAIGVTAVDKNEEGSGNIGIGYNALRDTMKSYNVAIGHHVLRTNDNHNNTAVGSYAGAESTSDNLVAVGYRAMNKVTAGQNTAVGAVAMENAVYASNNVAVGRASLNAFVEGHDNTAIGQNSIRNLTTGSRNVAIGQDTGTSLTTGSNNILIGESVNTLTPDSNDYMNIGKLIYGDLLGKKVGIGLDSPLARLHIGAGTTSVAPLRINAGSLLTTPSQHSFEYDGAFLYFTSSNGIRRKITTEVVA